MPLLNTVYIETPTPFLLLPRDYPSDAIVWYWEGLVVPTCYVSYLTEPLLCVPATALVSQTEAVLQLPAPNKEATVEPHHASDYIVTQKKQTQKQKKQKQKKQKQKKQKQKKQKKQKQPAVAQVKTETQTGELFLSWYRYASGCVPSWKKILVPYTLLVEDLSRIFTATSQRTVVSVARLCHRNIIRLMDALLETKVPLEREIYTAILITILHLKNLPAPPPETWDLPQDEDSRVVLEPPIIQGEQLDTFLHEYAIG